MRLSFWRFFFFFTVSRFFLSPSQCECTQCTECTECTRDSGKVNSHPCPPQTLNPPAQPLPSVWTHWHTPKLFYRLFVNWLTCWHLVILPPCFVYFVLLVFAVYRKDNVWMLNVDRTRMGSVLTVFLSTSSSSAATLRLDRGSRLLCFARMVSAWLWILRMLAGWW